jgi:hypothetical protein
MIKVTGTRATDYSVIQSVVIPEYMAVGFIQRIAKELFPYDLDMRLETACDWDRELAEEGMVEIFNNQTEVSLLLEVVS